MTATKNRNWSQETIVSEIQTWSRDGRPLYSHFMRQNFQELLAAGIRYFGSWKLAVQSAGLPYDAVRKYKKWTKESIVSTIQELRQQGVDLSFRSMMLSAYAPMVYAAIRTKYFGSWRIALEAAGLPAEDIYRYRSWDESSILDEIRQLNEKGIDLSSKKMDETENSLIATARRRFGSWEKAVTRAGLDYNDIRRRQRWTREKVVSRIQELLQEHPDLRGIDARRLDPSLFAAACKPRLFGNWSKALESAKANTALVS